MDRIKKDDTEKPFAFRPKRDISEEMHVIKEATCWTNSILLEKLVEIGIREFPKEYPDFYRIVEKHKRSHHHEHLEKKRA